MLLYKHSSYDELRMSDLEVRRSHPRPEPAGVATQVSRIASNAPRCVSNRRIHEDLMIPFFAYCIIGLTESFDSMLDDSGSLVVWQLGTYANKRAD